MNADDHEVIIAGAGPAGSSAAIHLARRGVKVLLVEQKKFPRAKLCGEFISPECMEHFCLLGIEREIAGSNPAILSETGFYSRKGRGIRVPSDWFVGRNSAVGLSRAQMDQHLIQRARDVGVEVMEEATVVDLLIVRDHVSGVRLKLQGSTVDKKALVTIDATGRRRLLVRKIKTHQNDHPNQPAKNSLVAFKAHLKNAGIAKGACEIYSYPGGYGGLSNIENDLSNLCFIVASSDVRRLGSDPEAVVQQIVFQNRRASETLADAEVCSEWLSVSLETFGRQRVVPFSGLLAAGDAAAFIDPFTGSGILMALESGQLASDAILLHLIELRRGEAFDSLARAYQTGYRRKFDSRLRVSGVLRHAAYLPHTAAAAIALFGTSDRLRRMTARATRI